MDGTQRVAGSADEFARQTAADGRALHGLRTHRERPRAHVLDWIRAMGFARCVETRDFWNGQRWCKCELYLDKYF